MTDEIILEVKNISKVFDHDIFTKKETVVRDISFSLRSGKCTGLLGHNGAGKTTTIRMMLGVLQPTKGHFEFKGQRFKKEDLKEVGYMPEINKLSPLLTPYETLDHRLYLLGFKPKGSRKEFILEKLESVGLAAHARKRNQKLSKGQGRRLSYAYATMHSPSFIILDEPFSGLDPIGRDFMVHSIENLRALGTSILLCTHEVEAVKKLCDDIIIMREGQKVFDSNEVEGDHAVSGKTKYQVSLSGLVESDLTHLAREFDLPSYLSVESRGYLHNLHFKDFEEASHWLQAAVKNGVVVVDFRELKQSFGDNEDLLKYIRRENVQ